MRLLRTTILFLLLGATLTGLLFYIYQNRLVSDKKNSGQFPNPTKTSISNSPAQPNRCINNSPQAQNSRPITIQKPELVKADDFFKEATSLHENYQYDEALDYFKMALKLYEQDKKFEQQAVTLGRIGTVYYHKANYKTAIDYHEKRLNIVRGIRRRAIDSKNNELLVKISQEEAAGWSSWGDAYYAMGNYPKARSYYKRSLNAARRIKDKRAEAIALGGVGSVYHSLGIYNKAIESHQKRLALIDKVLSNNQNLTEGERKEFCKLKGAALGSLGNVYHMQEKYLEAMERYKEHLEISQKNEDKQGEAIALGEMGSAYHSRWKRNGYNPNDPDLKNAIDHYTNRLNIAKETKNLRLVASTYGGLGYIYHSQKNYHDAILATVEFLKVSEKIGDKPGIANALDLLGVSRFKLSNIIKNEPNLPNQADKAAESQKYISDAIQNLKDAMNVRESLREGLTETEKIYIFDTQQNTYLNLQQVYVSQGQNDLALEIAERGRARAFVDLLTSKKERKVSKAINLERIKRIAQEQQATLVIYSQIKNSILDHEQPLYIWVVKPGQEKVVFEKVDLNKWTKQWSQSSSYLQIIKQGLQKDRVPNAALVSIPRNSMHKIKSRKGKIDVVNNQEEIISQKDLLAILTEYYKLLIKPNGHHLLPKENEKLIFIPQGDLFQIPFAALYDSEAKNYLIEKHPILTAPSIQALDIIRQRQQNRKSNRKPLEKKDWLILGVKNAKPNQFCSESEKLALAELEGAEEEAKNISVLFDIFPTVAVQEKTEAAVKQKMRQARMIHLATHGLLDSCQKEVKEDAEVPGAIALDASEGNDGWLTATEISQMELQADLIVLSACDTALGRLTADGVIGLSRSAISAGASSAIVSLWNVEDYSTAFLMTEFYRQLKEQSKSGKLDKAEALRQAMLNTKNYVDKDTKKKIYSEPYQWSAFTLVGEATTQLEKRQQ